MTNFVLTSGVDNFTGGLGVDDFTGPGGGNDVLDGAGGNDTFHIDSLQIGSIDGGAGIDTIFATDNELNIALSLANVEKLSLSTSNIYVTAAQLNHFSSILPESGGTDAYIFMQGAGGTVNFSSKFVSAQNLHVEASLTTSAVNLTGTAHGDSLTGSSYNDGFSAGAGNDTIFGLGGNDLISGGTGTNSIDGGSGVDTVTYGPGSYGAVTAPVTVNLAAGTATGVGLSDTLTSIENVTGTDFNDTITGDSHANLLNGRGGNDTLKGAGGQDRLVGEGGADTFVFAAPSDSPVGASNRDTILDFHHTDGDKINLHAIDANTGVSGNQDFSFIGTAAFSHHAGELNATPSGANLLVQGDVNGDALPDFSIVVANVPSLVAGDFVL
jgi:Ca2+-binding RTX toxin-like protein